MQNQLTASDDQVALPSPTELLEKKQTENEREVAEWSARQHLGSKKTRRTGAASLKRSGEFR